MTLKRLKTCLAEELATNRCQVVEEIGNGRVRVTSNCIVTGHPYSVDTTKSQWDQFCRGNGFVQDIFQDLSAGDREFILTGTSPLGWDQLFPPDEEDGGSIGYGGEINY